MIVLICRGNDCGDLQDLELKRGREGTQQHGPGQGQGDVSTGFEHKLCIYERIVDKLADMMHHTRPGLLFRRESAEKKRG